MAEGMSGLNLVLLGRTRAGKSSSGNTILGREAFVSKKSSRSVTRDVAVESGTVDGFPVTVYDTPGLFNTHMGDEEIQQMINENVLQRCESGRCVFLLVIKADRFTEEERRTVEKIEELLGEERLKKTWILFTGGDELEEENITIKEFINETEPLKRLIQKYDQRYHVFNNKKRGHTGQAKMLLMKILKTFIDTQEGGEILKPNPLMRKIPKDFVPDAPVSSPSSRRIVLLGKSGVGRSSSGNTILGQREFNSVQRMSSVTHESSAAHATVSGRSVSVVDTPGFFDTQMKPEELVTEIARSVYISRPGPHAFLIVFPVNMRFTEEEKQIPQMIEMIFGEEVLKYSIILFTHGDLIEERSIEKVIEENSRLRDLVQQCGGRYHVFNNRDENNRDQVNDLLQKIDTMIEQNEGGHYSNQMYEDAQRLRREEEERRWRKEVRAEMKTESGFQQFFAKHKTYFVTAGAAVGSVFGAAVGSVVGAAAVVATGGLILPAVAAGAAAGAGAHYRNEMYEDAERCRREEEERRQRQREERMQREEERRRIDQELRKQREEKQKDSCVCS